MQRVWKFLFVRGVEVLAVSAEVLFIVLIFLQVLFRYLIKSPISWSEEIIMLFFQWSIFLGAAICVRSGDHFRLNLLTKRLSHRAELCMDVFALLVMAAVAFTLLVKGWQMVMLTRNSTFATIDISRSFSYLAIPISGGLMILYLVPVLIQRVTAGKKARE